MTALWHASSAPARERAAAVCETVSQHVVEVDIDLPRDPDLIDVSLALTVGGPLQVLSVRAMATTVTRGARAARNDTEPHLFVTLQAAGRSSMTQHGREADLAPGRFALYTTSSPYTLTFDAGVDAHFFRIPVADLALPEAVIARASSLTLGDDDPVAALTAAHLHRIAVTPALRTPEIAPTLAEPTIGLVRAALLSCLGEPTAPDARHDTLVLRILEYLRAHLGDHDLTAAQVAAAHHLSVRHLYTVLGRSGITVGEWLRTHRLEACRRELSRPEARDRTIAAIAAQWGFADAAHFSRAFRQTYGMSPREWRMARARSPSAGAAPGPGNVQGPGAAPRPGAAPAP